MYNNEPCDSNDEGQPSSYCSADGDGLTDDDDDSSIEEIYSECKEDNCNNNNLHASENEDYEADNLICPGDVIEYCTINDMQSVRRSSVDTIIDNKTNSFITLKSGYILRQKKTLCAQD